MGWDWPYLWTTIPMQVLPNGVVQTFPDNFLKAEDDQALRVETTAGNPMARIVLELDHKAYWKQVPSQSQIVDATVPRVWTMDYGTRTGIAYPRPREVCQCSFRCKLLPPDFPIVNPDGSDNSVAYDADIPVFPYDELLTDLLFEWAMSYEVDPRRAEQYQLNAERVMRARGSAFPERSYPSTVPLDPQFFSTPWNGWRGY